MSVWEAVKTKSCWRKLGGMICLLPPLGGSSLFKVTVYGFLFEKTGLMTWEGGYMVKYEHSQYTCLQESVMSHTGILEGMTAKVIMSINRQRAFPSTAASSHLQSEL